MVGTMCWCSSMIQDPQKSSYIRCSIKSGKVHPLFVKPRWMMASVSETWVVLKTHSLDMVERFNRSGSRSTSPSFPNLSGFDSCSSSANPCLWLILQVSFFRQTQSLSLCVLTGAEPGPWSRESGRDQNLREITICQKVPQSMTVPLCCGVCFTGKALLILDKMATRSGPKSSFIFKEKKNAPREKSHL